MEFLDMFYKYPAQIGNFKEREGRTIKMHGWRHRNPLLLSLELQLRAQARNTWNWRTFLKISNYEV